jgi:cytochrome P450
MVRKVKVDHERGGQLLRAKAAVYLGIASANHDPSVFRDPGSLDLTRDPNPHFGFGWGMHYCLGTNLARLEAQVALRTLLERFPAMASEGPVAAARASALGYGRRPLPVRLGQPA